MWWYNEEIDASSKEVQETIVDFNDKLTRCYLCDEMWFEIFGHDIWYPKFRDWVADGDCIWHTQGLGKFEKTVPPEKFYLCLLTTKYLVLSKNSPN